MAPASGDDDTIASADAPTHAATARSVDVDLGSAQTVGSGSSALPESGQVLPTVSFESYVRIDEYARGGLGRIIRAKDQRTGRTVAIKEMLADHADAAARFVREAMVTANLQHPAIVPVYEVGQWPDGKPFYAMKLVRGRALNDVIAATANLDGRLALISHVAAVADALAYAHGERVIHRDLKPHNVLCGDFGETVVIDWGLARRLDERDAAVVRPSTSVAVGETHVGAVMGTPSYMAPEQARGERVDERCDVYAIGAILYHVLAGRPPHVGSDLAALLAQVQNATPAKLSADVPPDLVAIVEHALAKDPAQRYPSAAELASELRRFMTGQLVLAHHYTRRERIARFVARNRGALAVAVAALAVVGVGSTIAIRNIVVARGEATASRDEARTRLVASYADRAGLELVNGQPARSLAYTIASAEQGGLTPQTRLMAQHALDQLPPVRRGSFGQFTAGQFVPGSHDLVISKNEVVVRWDPDTDRVRWRIPTAQSSDVVIVGRDTLVFARLKTSVAIVSIEGTSIAEMAGSPNVEYTGFVGADDGKRWVAAVAKHQIDLFDMTTRTLVASIPLSIASRMPTVAADGEHVIVTSNPPEMAVLDRTGKKVATFRAEAGNLALAGEEIIYAPPLGANGIARLVVGDWTGKVRLDLSVGTSKINSFAADIPGQRIALGTDDGVVQVRSLVSGDVLWQTSLLSDRALDMAFDGGVLRVVSLIRLVGFDAASGIEVERVVLSGIHVAVSDDQRRVAVSSETGLIVWSAARGEMMPVAPTIARVTDLAFAPDGGVVSAGDDGEIHEVRDGRSVRRLGTGASINTLTRLDDGTSIAVNGDGMIVVRDRDGRELRRFSSGMSARLSPGSRALVAASANNIMAIWDAATGMRVRDLGTFGVAGLIRWSGDGRRIGAVSSNGDASVWNVDGGVVRKLLKGKVASAIAISHDGRWLVRTGDPVDTIFGLDGNFDRRIERQPGPTIVAAFSADDKTVLLAGTGYLSTWDVATATPRLQLATNSWVTSVAFVDDDRFIVGGTIDGRIHVWSAENGAELLAFAAPGTVRKVIVERSGSRVGVLTDRGALIWMVPSFQGTLDDLRESARCRTSVAIVDGHLRPRAVDIAACTRATQ